MTHVFGRCEKMHMQLVLVDEKRDLPIDQKCKFCPRPIIEWARRT